MLSGMQLRILKGRACRIASDWASGIIMSSASTTPEELLAQPAASKHVREEHGASSQQHPAAAGIYQPGAGSSNNAAATTPQEPHRRNRQGRAQRYPSRQGRRPTMMAGRPTKAAAVVRGLLLAAAEVVVARHRRPRLRHRSSGPWVHCAADATSRRIFFCLLVARKGLLLPHWPGGDARLTGRFLYRRPHRRRSRAAGHESPRRVESACARPPIPSPPLSSACARQPEASNDAPPRRPTAGCRQRHAQGLVDDIVRTRPTPRPGNAALGRSSGERGTQHPQPSAEAAHAVGLVDTGWPSARLRRAPRIFPSGYGLSGPPLTSFPPYSPSPRLRPAAL